MKIKRTANAGALLELDGVRILLDGVCLQIEPYLATPEVERRDLLKEPPDVVAFTHTHADHYDAAFVSDYLQKAAGPILGPADIPFSTQNAVIIGNVRIFQIPTHHLGKVDPIAHHSFIVKGSQCVWFTGDASPLVWKRIPDLPKPDVIIAPYAYAMGSGWQISLQTGANRIILLHMPNKEKDPYGLWGAVESTVKSTEFSGLLIPEMGAAIEI